MFSSDRLSTWMGAPPNHWKEIEREMMRNIQRCYQVAYSSQINENVEIDSDNGEEDEDVFTTNNGTKIKITGEERHIAGEEVVDDAELQEKMRRAGNAKDEEKFLPQNSPLRSVEGAKKEPANAPFKDYETFMNSCRFDHWKHYFDRANGDKVVVETARGLISKICTVQSRNELRSHNGHVPFRKKREQITPLALVLHEIKDWCVTFLRTCDPMHEDSFKEINCRIVYIEGLSHKEVWGNSVVNFGQGMRNLAHDRLFRLLISARQELRRAEEYCYRSYCRRSSREKLGHIGNTLKDLLLNEMRVISGRFQVESKLSDPKTSRLQPMDLLNAIENMQFVDFKNIVNVLLYKVFSNDFVKACFTGDYDSPKVTAVLNSLDSWSKANYFCQGDMSNPKYKFEKRREFAALPEVYKPTAAELKVLIRKVDSRTPVPDTSRKVLAKLKGAYENEKVVAEVIKLMMQTLASVQNLIPSLFAVHKLWTLAGEGGDFTIYDNMREHVIRVMKDIMDRIHVLKKTTGKLRKFIHRRCELKEQEIKKINMKRGKMVYKPDWVNNHRFIATELSKVSEKSYKSSLKKLMEVANDAKEYNLTTDQLSDKVQEAKKIFDMLTGHKSEVTEKPVVQQEEEQIVVPVRRKKDKDSYIASRTPVMDDSDDDEDMVFGGGYGRNGSAVPSRKVMYDSDDSMGY